MAVDQWLHAGLGGLPLQGLLNELPDELALRALAAVPEEANAKELKLDGSLRPQLLLELQHAAPEVLQHLSARAGERSLPAATSWLALCRSTASLLEELGQATLPHAAQLLREDSERSGPAAEFLETLMEKSGACDQCPERLAQSLLVLLGHLQPTGAEARPEQMARHRLGRLVSAAVDAWRRFYVVPGTPREVWVTLLEALIACGSWGHQLALVALPSWLGLHEQALKAGPEVFETYAPVLLKAARNLRNASVFPGDFHQWMPEDTETFLQFRRELRDFLRELGTEKTGAENGGSPKARQRKSGPGVLLPLLVEEIHRDLVQALVESSQWQPTEEALHALSALAKEIMVMAPAHPIAGRVLELLRLLAGDQSPLLRPGCHRQLISIFVQCASVFGPLCTLDEATFSKIFTLARASLRIVEEAPTQHTADTLDDE
ncbi:Uncharacterized protein SCF082_LOCUS5807 [Durusdinium trenchii]|uniref:Uncharacterized protein n=1 Tax=Durusdinium trenchii TaxID=1381693 RepID=A0ABP0IAC0_9DINO